jgi:UDP-2,3-diacylglucosamine pyrophosphatase LpxH
VLEGCRKGDTLILLGDILDFWIRGNEGHWPKDRVVGSWKTLYRELAPLRKREVDVHYVAGNHDSFLFYLEAGYAFEWTDIVLRKSQALTDVFHETARYRMSKVATVHYPFYKLTLSPEAAPKITILFTHGHTNERYWRVISGMPESSPSTKAFVTALTTALSHRFAYPLRAVGQISEHGLRRVTDTGLQITNAVVTAYYLTKGKRVDDNLEEFARLLENAFRDYFDDASRKESDALDIKAALLTVQQFDERSDLVPFRDLTREMLRREAHRDSNFTIRYVAPTGYMAMSHMPYNELTEFDRFVRGHTHEASQNEEDPADACYDTGCFAYKKEKYTFLQINPDGRFLYPVDAPAW